MAARYSAATERALQRVDGNQPIKASALAEGIDPSTLFRALKARRNSGASASQRRAVIVGAGSLGRELAGWMRVDGIGVAIAFVDDLVPAFVCTWLGAPATYQTEAREDDEVFLAVAAPKARERIAQQIGGRCATFVASSSISGNCAIGAGSLLLPHTLVSADATLGACVVVNTYSSIGHDVQIGDFCTLASHVDLMGRVKVGARAFLGSGARVLPGLSIGEDAVIGAGAVVVRDVPAGATVFGNPARVTT